MNAENLILAGIWQGPIKSLILPPVLGKINHLKANGIVVQTPSGLRKVKACLVVGVFDFPAKAMATTMTQCSEFRAWLLYYALPVLSDLLPGDCIYHLSHIGRTGKG